MATTEVVPTSDEPGLPATLVADGLLLGRVVVAAGLLGAVTVGVVGRLAMFALARLNPLAQGIDSDDGFTMGQFTLSGSVNLLTAGMAFGVLSGILWLAFRPLQVGPAWFRRLSVSVGAGVVVGAMLVHQDGRDFTMLQPAELGIAMFVALPILHVALVDLLGTRIVDGRLLRDRRWGVLGLVVSLPLVPLVAAIAAVRSVVLLGRRHRDLAPVLASPAWGHLGRLGLTVLFVLAVLDLVDDVGYLV